MQNTDDYQHYPSPAEIDVWAESLLTETEKERCGAEFLNVSASPWPEQDGYPYRYGVRHNRGNDYVRFTPESGVPFYGYWQPAVSAPSKLLVHVPGYGAELSAHPELVAEGYNVLHINPLGYCTPAGIDFSLSPDRNNPLAWPQLSETVRTYGKSGYARWFSHCIHAVTWAMKRPEVLPGQVSFFGTSQGGGGSLILASLFRDKGCRCAAADLPFLTDYPLAAGRGAYELVKTAMTEVSDNAKGLKSLGFFDTLSHAHRLTLPVLLTAGGLDDTCPAETVESLFGRLPGVKSYTYLKYSEHRYTAEFLQLIRAWFRLYA